MKTGSFLIKYTAFAMIAMLTNISIQRIILSIGDTKFSYIYALVLGTIGGLIVKFYLDKNWIFYASQQNSKKDFMVFLHYSALGLTTTFIFWVVETIFWFTWNTSLMREVGAIIGLSLGYILKYNLDKRFVFNRSEG